MSRLRPAGTTLIELMIVIAILGFLASVVTIAIRRMSPAPDDLRNAIVRVRRDAATRGVTIHLSRVEHDHPFDVTVFPDGHVVADSGIDVGMLNGRAGAEVSP